MKFRFISDHRETFKVGRMCKLLNVTRSGYHAWVKRPESPRSQENRTSEAKIPGFTCGSATVFTVHQESIGILSMTALRAKINRVARIMRKAGIRSRTRKKFKATVNSRHNFPVAPNLLNQQFNVDALDHTWAGDITYIHTSEGWLYLAVLLDLFNREVIGCSTSSRLTRQLIIYALQMALGRRNPGNNLMHHSDQGSQYASTKYQKIFGKKDIICSMSRKGNCYDNTVVEDFLVALKVSGSTTIAI